MISAICLLAGYSSRMGQPKQHIEIASRSFLEIIIEKLKANSGLVNEIILVGQQKDKKAQKLAIKFDCLWVSNPDPERGPLSSIKLALAKKSPDNGILLWPVDHPLVELSTVKTLLNAFVNHPDRIIVPSINNRRGHPPIFPDDLQPDFFSIPENEGARKILQLYPERILHITTDDIWVRKNINTPELLQEAKQTLNCQRSVFNLKNHKAYIIE